MHGGHDGAHARLAFGDGGKCDARSEHSFFEKFAGEIHGQTSVADDDGCDRRFAGWSALASNVEAEQAQFFFPESRVLPELLHPLRLGFEDIESCDAGGGNRGRMRGRKQKRPRAVIKKVDEVARAADISAQSADCLRQSSDLNIDAPMHSEMIDRTPTLAAEHAGRMRIVDHHDRAIFLRRIAQAG